MVSVRTWIAAAAALLTGSAAMAAGGNAGWLSTLDRAASAEAQKPAVTVRLAAENRGLTPQAENRLAVVLEH